MPKEPDGPDNNHESGDSVDPSSPAPDSFLRAAAGVSGVPSVAVAAALGRSSQPSLAAGQLIAKRYRLDHELGRGGMGVVWAATHLVTGRRVAVKFLLGHADPHAELRRRFLREARAAAAVDHPNVVEVIDVVELEDETPAIVMELLSGETLRDKLAREKRLPLAHAASILLPVAEAVATAHARGIVHRDLKPENIFLAQSTRWREHVKVLDFGIAKLVGLATGGSETDAVTGTGSTLGTPCYMAPEQTLGQKDIDHRADIWSLGVILYECLAGVRPLQGSSVGQVVLQLATEGVRHLEQVVPGLPKEATALVMRMLARERTDRPQDLKDVCAALSRLAQGDAPASATTMASHSAPVEERSPSIRLPVEARSSKLPSPPAVDTNEAQAAPSGARLTSRRSLVVAVSAAGGLLAAFATWRLSSPARLPSAARAPEGATSVDAPPALAAPTQFTTASLVPAASADETPSAAPTATTKEAPGVQDAGGVPTSTRRSKPAATAPTAAATGRLSATAAPPAPVASPGPPTSPAPKGFADKAPF
jgi:serine/threonine protein kinase